MIVIALGAWLWDMHEANRSLRQDLDLIETQRNRIETDWILAKENLNDANEIIATLQTRPPTEIVRTIIHDVPADCEKCIDSYELPIAIKDERGLWAFHSPDIFSDPGKLELTPKFDAEVIQPWRDALDTCENSLKTCLERPKSPLCWTQAVEARVGVGLYGYEAQIAYSPLEFGGRRFKVSPVAWMSASIQPEVIMSGAIGIKVEFSK